MSFSADPRPSSTPPSQEGSQQQNANGRKRKRNLNHVSKACDECRTRKRRCDAGIPQCGQCIEKGFDCAYEKTDGRKNRRESGSIREQLEHMKSLLSATLQTPQPNPLPADTSARSQIDIILSNNLPSSTNPQPQRISPNTNLPIPTYQTIPIEQPINYSPPIWDPFESRTQDVWPQSNSQPSLIDGRGNGMSCISLSGAPKEPLSVSPITATGLPKPTGNRSRIQYGATSFWSYAPDTGPRSSTPQTDTVDLRPGDWVDWARHLPPDLNITKRQHDAALTHFGAYYAPWCMAVNMTTFLRDMEVCNLVTRIPTDTSPPRWTSSYSPLLHNCALHLGLHMNRQGWPDLAASMDTLLAKHCAGMLIDETDDPNLSTPRALALFASCMNLRREDSAHKTGYIHFGMAYACVQALGINVKCDHLVTSGQITTQERDLHSTTYWTMFQLDLLRGICAGRPCMLKDNSEIPLAPIDLTIDNEPWVSSTPSNPINGLNSMRSTIYHWSVKLARLLRQVVDISLSSDVDTADRDSQVGVIHAKLQQWYHDQPFPQPRNHPVPHLLELHMVYHLTLIYLFRPYFRATSRMDPSPAQRCERAAVKITELLRTFDETHGLQNGVATIIPVIFGSATIRLLALVSSPNGSPGYRDNVKTLDECAQFMDKIAITWNEARRGLEVIKFLMSEWIPPNHPIDDGNIDSQPPVVGPGDGVSSDQFAEILQDWLSRNNPLDMFSMDLPFPQS